MIRRKDIYNEVSNLSISKEVRVRFNETDALGIVWHGNYLTYFEDGREAFGRHYGISYLDALDNGYVTPIVSSNCSHKLTVKYGDVLRVETAYINTSAAKIIFRFKIFNQKDELVCTGETVQVFLDKEGNLSLQLPAFYEEWKKKVGLI
ncbi:MAG: acyl-CoA thioesterase [Flavobacteriaceae bacterium]|jgi:acyl-CoA thioester hydrolase|nr:acyl-CoA thioesterase [Flavobacteriaceae bacterium]